MAIVLLIIFIVTLLILIIYILKGLYNTKKLVELFKHGNVITFGRKGKGKDIIHQIVINARKKPYKANIDYGRKYEHVEVKELSIAPNTYQSFIEGKITKIAKVGEDGHDVYLSDGGIILPSQHDQLLHKYYPSFPIYYALSRHLYLQNIHINTQSLGRPWKAIREQADNYVKACGVKSFFFFWLKVEYITYTKYESAQLELEPMGNRLFNKYSKAEQDQFRALHGEIVKRYSFIRKKAIKYDTRAFADIIFNNIDKDKQVIKEEEKPKEESTTTCA